MSNSINLRYNRIRFHTKTHTSTVLTCSRTTFKTSQGVRVRYHTGSMVATLLLLQDFAITSLLPSELLWNLRSPGERLHLTHTPPAPQCQASKSESQHEQHLILVQGSITVQCHAQPHNQRGLHPLSLACCCTDTGKLFTAGSGRVIDVAPFESFVYEFSILLLT